MSAAFLILESMMNAEVLTLSRLKPLSVRPVSRDDIPDLLRLCAEHAEVVAFERLPYGRARQDPMELIEALFEPPLRAWAWLLRAGDEAVGYAAATVGFSLLERGYYLQLEPWHVRPLWRAGQADRLLLEQARELAAKLGCLNLQWQAPAWSLAGRPSGANAQATRIDTTRYVLPAGAALLSDASANA
jgi:hypothetical protein